MIFVRIHDDDKMTKASLPDEHEALPTSGSSMKKAILKVQSLLRLSSLDLGTAIYPGVACLKSIKNT